MYILCIFQRSLKKLINSYMNSIHITISQLSKDSNTISKYILC